MITEQDLLPKIKIFEELDDIDTYDDQLLQYIKSGMSELSNSGIPIPENMGVFYVDQYTQIIKIGVAIMFDNDINIFQYKLIRENQIENLRNIF